MWVLAIATVFGYMHYFGICKEIFVIIPSAIAIVMQIVVVFAYGRTVGKVKQVKNEKVKLKKGKELVYALFDTEYYLKTVEEPILKKLTKE